MRKMTLVKKMLWLLVLPMFFGACESKLDEHYESPSWLKGSTWEILESEGNYSIFLAGIKRANYEQIVAGKNILTIMAPNDDAFKKYFAAHNIGSLESLSDTEVKKLIGFHLMYYSYNTSKLVNFRPEGDGVSDDQASVAAGMYYKHRTKSSDPTETYTDPKDNKTYKIYHTERLLPVFSYKLFETKGIDAATNYEYFYPNSTWTGNQSFNVSNASLMESEIVTGNGYLYKIDQVLEPLETIYTELSHNNNFSKFLGLYDGYSYLIYDPDASLDYGNGDSLFYHKHESPLADIACEWPVTDYRLISTLSSSAYSIFAPSNTALENFFQSYWKEGGYTSLEDVSSTAMAYLIKNCVYSGTLVFPSEIKDKKITNSFNSLIDFDVDAVPVANRKMCSNGLLYGLEEVAAPSMFNSVTGPAFKYKKFSDYVYMLDYSSMLVALASEETKFTLLMPDNDQIEKMGYQMNEDNILIDINDESKAVSTSTMRSYVNLHTVTGINGIPQSGTQVLETNRARDYWFVKDGKITTSALFNSLMTKGAITDETFFAVHEIAGDWTNGKAYTYDTEELLVPTDGNTQLSKKLVTNDETENYYQFSKLLQKAGIIQYGTDGAGQIVFGGSRNIYFVPTNAAIQAAIAAGRIPGIGTDGNLIEINGSTTSSQNKLLQYMLFYIISTASSNVSYPYVGSNINGFFNIPLYGGLSESGEKRFYSVQIVDDGSKLSVAPAFETKLLGAPVDVVDTYYYFPFAFNDGCVHFIKDVFDVDWSLAKTKAGMSANQVLLKN